MSCGCNGGGRASRVVRSSSTQHTRQAAPHTTAAVAAGAKVFYEVWKDGRFTGRRSQSLVTAQTVADRLGGEVRSTD